MRNTVIVFRLHACLALFFLSAVHSYSKLAPRGQNPLCITSCLASHGIANDDSQQPAKRRGQTRHFGTVDRQTDTKPLIYVSLSWPCVCAATTISAFSVCLHFLRCVRMEADIKMHQLSPTALHPHGRCAEFEATGFSVSGQA